MGGESVQWSVGTRWFDGRAASVGCGLWVECHMEEFCVKVLKFEIVNSRKLFIHFSGVVPRAIEFVPPVMLFPGRFKNGPFKRRQCSISESKLGIAGCWWVPTHRAHRLPPSLPGYLKGVWAIQQASYERSL
jgi:hypothetical protein